MSTPIFINFYQICALYFAQNHNASEGKDINPRNSILPARRAVLSGKSTPLQCGARTSMLMPKKTPNTSTMSALVAQPR